jgi:hypothetical protein
MSREERWQLSGNAAEFYERYVRPSWSPGCVVSSTWRRSSPLSTFSTSRTGPALSRA